MNTEYNCGLPSGLLDDLIVYLSGGPGNAMVQELILETKQNYVTAKHPYKIYQLHTDCKYKNGSWKTYVRKENEHRKEVIRKTKKELYEWLYEYYKEQEKSSMVLQIVFQEFQAYKRSSGRVEATIYENSRHFAFLSEALKGSPIKDITEEDLREWLMNDYLLTKPREGALRKELQLLNQIFEYGIRKKYCNDNPMKYLAVEDYLKYCNLNKKSDEEREFSEKELASLKEYALNQIDNPRAQIMLLSMETGLRIGELVALHRSDIKDGYIHVHRQQRKEHDKDGHLIFVEVPYTKNERQHPRDGRMVPITLECAEALKYPLENKNDNCPYLFHQDGKWITTDSCHRFLNRICKRLGTTATNNHAFRLAFNSRLIQRDISSDDRALMLGHKVQTNERHYSVSDKRRLESLKDRLN